MLFDLCELIPHYYNKMYKHLNTTNSLVEWNVTHLQITNSLQVKRTTDLAFLNVLLFC